MMASSGIRIVTISGSVREGNYTSKALALVHNQLSQDQDASFEAMDAAALDLPPPGSDSLAAQRLRKTVSGATGIVLATPEYHGSYSSVIKRVIENLGFPSVLSGKPVALLGVAAGSIGAIKALEHLRSVVSHVGGLALPGPVSVANVRSVFDDDGRCLDPRIEKQIRGVGTNLLQFIRKHICPTIALEQMVREKAG